MANAYVGKADTIENQNASISAALEVIFGRELTDEERAEIARIADEARAEVAAEKVASD